MLDLIEPWRFLGDVATLEAFESGVLDLPDFYFTGDDYRYKIEDDAKRRFLMLLKERINGGVRYRGRDWKYDSLIQVKVMELARFLLGQSDHLSFIEPAPRLKRNDSKELRHRILSFKVEGAERLGIGKSTLHDMQKPERNEATFRVYSKVTERLRV